MSAPGRPRDVALDEAILDHAAALLREGGVEAVTFSRVADMAGTTRPALYRRYDSPQELAVAALQRVAVGTLPPRTGDHLADLRAELRNFRDGIASTNSIALVGSMLTPGVEENLATAYRDLLVQPRRTRIREILTDAAAAGLLTAPAADLDIAVTMCTGSFYAFALAGTPPPPDWPRRTADLVWRAAGGDIAAG